MHYDHGNLNLTLSPGTEAVFLEQGHEVGSIGLQEKQTGQVRIRISLSRSIRVIRRDTPDTGRLRRHREPQFTPHKTT